MDIKKVFGANVRFYRKCKGFSQEALSEKLDIGSNHLSKIERGAAFVSAELLEHLIAILDIPAEALFSSIEKHRAGDAALAHFEHIVEEELRRTTETITRRMRSEPR
ncbi:MAG: helix-turn-helix domain-containing protein [Treponema sp.]|jgi:transcriptional regulator with XRE-family HTH domain|nr:helix-turn-helix domain-containing protein [Treponema sp.]